MLRGRGARQSESTQRQREGSSAQHAEPEYEKRKCTQCQPVFILVRALVGDVVVEERHIKTRVVKLIAAVPQQPNSIILGLPDILLKIEQAHVDAGVQRRPKYERVMT